MDELESPAHPRLSPRAKLTIGITLAILAAAFLLQVRGILSPFLWAILTAYWLTPVVNYLNVRGGLPRLWCVFLVFATIILALVSISSYLYPRLVEQGSVFIEDIPRLEASLISLVGPNPLGVNIQATVKQVLDAVQGSTGNPASASHLLENAFTTLVKVFLYVVSSFYLLYDGPRIRQGTVNLLPLTFRDELLALGHRINLTWQQYIRGELLLFVIMASATTIGLAILQVPGAIFLGLISGVLELLPLVGPFTAGALAVSVAYFNGTNPWNLSQVAYAGLVAVMYFIFRQLEDYFIMPHVLGRAVQLHPLVVLFALTTGGVFGGLLGLLLAVPIAACLKAVFAYLYAKMLDLPPRFEPIRTIRGEVIEIPYDAPIGFPLQDPATGEAPAAHR